MVDSTFDMIQKRIQEKNEKLAAENAKIASSTKEIKINNKLDIPITNFILPCGQDLKIKEVYVDTEQCKIWSGNNRLEETRNDSSLEELKQAIEAGGQLIPGFIRPLKDDSQQHKYEVIYGSRRFAACKALGKKFYAICGDIDNKNALLLMDAENNARKELSAYEKALSYKQWISDGIFKDRKDLAQHLGTSEAWISRTQSILKLPEEILGAFPRKSDISVWWSTELLKIVKQGEASKLKLIEVALKKPSSIIEPKSIFEYLLSSAKISSNKPTSKLISVKNKEKVLDKDGNLICSITSTSAGKIQVTFEKNHTPETIKDLIQKSINNSSAWEF